MKEHKKKLASIEIDSKLYKTFQKLFTSCAVDDCRLEFTHKGIDIAVVDPSNVAMMWTTLESSVFDDFKCKKAFEVGWDFEDVKSAGLMSTYSGNITIDFFEVDGITDEYGHMCEIKHDIFNTSISLPSSSYIRSKPRIPPFPHNCAFNISKESFKKIADRGEFITVKSLGDSVVCSGGTTKRTWETIGMETKVNANGSSLYSTDCLINFLKALPKKSEIDFKFSTDMPCSIICEIVDGFKINYLLAPRIESD